MVYLADVTHLKFILAFMLFFKFFLCNFNQTIYSISTEEYFRYINFGSDDSHMTC
jgi:hypothetical protein